MSHYYAVGARVIPAKRGTSRNSYVTSRYVTRRQTGLFTYASVFNARRKEQRERKKENERRYFTKQEGQPGQICIPDFPVYLDAIESYDRYVHVTYVSFLILRDLLN